MSHDLETRLTSLENRFNNHIIKNYFYDTVISQEPDLSLEEKVCRILVPNPPGGHLFCEADEFDMIEWLSYNYTGWSIGVDPTGIWYFTNLLYQEHNHFSTRKDALMNLVVLMYIGDKKW